MSTDPGPGRDLDLVQLGPVEVDPSVLEGPGASLWDLLGATWVNGAGDHMTVHGWILDENGQRIVPGLFLFSDAPRLPDIAPDDRMSLRVDLVTRDVEHLPPGRYTLVAELHDLALTSPPGALVLYASPPEAM